MSIGGVRGGALSDPSKISGIQHYPGISGLSCPEAQACQSWSAPRIRGFCRHPRRFWSRSYERSEQTILDVPSNLLFPDSFSCPSAVCSHQRGLFAPVVPKVGGWGWSPAPLAAHCDDQGGAAWLQKAEEHFAFAKYLTVHTQPFIFTPVSRSCPFFTAQCSGLVQ